MTKKLEAYCILFCLIYGGLSAFFSAWHVGATVDEAGYAREGIEYLATRQVSARHEPVHPPFSKWFGALGLKLFNYDPDAIHGPMRSTHVFLYVFCMALICFGLWKNGPPGSSFVMAVFLATCPNLKAMVSLHVTDGDSAMLTLLAVSLTILNHGRLPPLRARLAGIAMGLSLTAKLSALVMAPPMAIIQTIKGRAGLAHWLIGVIIGFSAGYLFQIWMLQDFLLIIRNAADYLGTAHMSFIHGHYSESGFRSYFLWLLAFKIPPLIQAVTLAGISSCLFHPQLRGKERLYLWVILLIVVVELTFLSFGKLQIGIRHFLPGLLLLYLIAAFEAGPRITRHRGWAITFALLCLVTDARALYYSTYIGYSNFWTPFPATRQMADSNLDWAQGIPEWLKNKIPGASGDTSERLDLVLSLEHAVKDSQFRQTTIVGATSLTGFWSVTAPLWRMFKPANVMGGYEVHYLGATELFALGYWSGLTYSPMAPQSEYDQMLIKATGCISGKPEVSIERLSPQEAKSKLRELVERLPDGTRVWIQLGPDDAGKIVVQSNGQINSQNGALSLIKSGPISALQISDSKRIQNVALSTLKCKIE